MNASPVMTSAPALARPTQPPAATPTAPPHWHSTELLAQGVEARILHGDQVYRLRLTSLGKLILTK